MVKSMPRVEPPPRGTGLIGGGERQVIALDLDVEIVFKRQCERVVQRQVELAVADQRAQAVSVAGEEPRDVRSAERTKEADEVRTKIEREARRLAWCAGVGRLGVGCNDLLGRGRAELRHRGRVHLHC